jgi:hypothetical protein
MMNSEQMVFFQEINSFSLDDVDASLPFSKRLAREQGWSLQYAQRVIEEYKKFTFLAVVAGFPVTPSEHIDQAWHLHLTYTRSYWDDFCPNILQRLLHHSPTLGGSDERSKFMKQYEQTLESYELFFGCLPPCDIWPAPEARFSQQFRPQNQRVTKEMFHLSPVRVCLLGAIAILATSFYSLRPLAPSQSVGAPLSTNFVLVNSANTPAVAQPPVPTPTPSVKPSEEESKPVGWWWLFWLGLFLMSLFFGSNDISSSSSGWSIGGGDTDGDDGDAGCGGCGGCGD